MLFYFIFNILKKNIKWKFSFPHRDIPIVSSDHNKVFFIYIKTNSVLSSCKHPFPAKWKFSIFYFRNHFISVNPCYLKREDVCILHVIKKSLTSQRPSKFLKYCILYFLNISLLKKVKPFLKNL